MDLLDAFLAIVRTVGRAPLVNMRLLVDTPSAWAPAVVAGALVALAWWHDRRTPDNSPGSRVIEVLTGIAGLAFLGWFFRAGQFPWTEGDWREEWVFFFAWREALSGGGMPYYLATAMQGTERYFANLQTPMMPYAGALAFVDVRSFLLFHLAFVYTAGFLGAVALRRELRLRLLPWTIFLLVFTLNGHIASHLSVGHLPWVAYFLLPWLLVSAIRVARGDRSWRTVLTCGSAFGGMILIGGWHVFVWALLFLAFACLLSWKRLVVLTWIGVITALLAAARLAPAVATFGAGTNTFGSGYPSVASLLAALVDAPIDYVRLERWELDAYVGYAGFLLLCLGAVPFRDAARRFMNVLLLPAGALLVLSFGNVYGVTFFRLPGFVSERVTTRLVILSVLWLAVAGVVRLDGWWRVARLSPARSAVMLLGAGFLILQLVLRVETWRPHAGSPLDALPSEVLKAMPVEPLYYWMFWCGAVVSLVSAFAVTRALATRASADSP